MYILILSYTILSYTILYYPVLILSYLFVLHLTAFIHPLCNTNTYLYTGNVTTEVFNNSVKKNITRNRAKLGVGNLLKIGMTKWNANMLATIGQWSLVIIKPEYRMAELIVIDKYLFF